jgi:nicotianamine synthase
MKQNFGSNSKDSTMSTLTPPRTPTSTSTSAHTLFAEIQSIYTSLSTLPSLSPGPQTNALLTRLVSLCIAPYTSHFTTSFFGIHGVHEVCEALRPLCATAEGELEKYWAHRIIQTASSTPTSTKANLLDAFPYHQNYIDLSRLECSVLSAYLPASPRRIAFIGSGPLPLTSLCIMDNYPEARVHNIDRDAGALDVSRELCAELGVSGMTFGCEDVSQEGSETDWKEFEVVFLAALVGMDNETKMGILGSLARKLKRGTLVVARSARGLRSVLYPVRLLYEYQVDERGTNRHRFWRLRMTWKIWGCNCWWKCIRGQRL